MTQPSHEQPPTIDNIAERIRRAIVPGGAAVGGIGAFWELFVNSEGEIPKAIASATIGLGLSYGAAMLKPFHAANQRRAAYTGQVVDEVTERAFAKVTRFEGKYLLCQASDCESVRAEGMAQREGIFEPLLKEVFVELQIDSSASLPGFRAKNSTRLDTEGFRKQTIWDFLAEAKKQKAFRQLAILAWGGYGKTTLLKHVAYRYGIGDVPKGTPKLVPVLLVLRKYRKQLSQENPPSLPAIINEYHILDLPEAHRLQPVPPHWAENLLKKGHALVMFDGFDEVPKEERPAVAKWINAQMRQYGKSVFVVASRPKAYKEQDTADRLVLSMPMWVQPFDDEQRRKFVENWYLCQEQLKARRDTPEVRKVADTGAVELLRQIEAQSELKDLAKNPLLLNMIATFHRRYPGAALPKRRVDLYGEICTLQLKARPRDRRLETVLLEFEPQPVLEQIAFGMMQTKLKRIDGGVLLREIVQALEALNEDIDANVFLKDVVRISELIVQQEDEYEFAHLSFQEYLAAAYVATAPAERETLLHQHLTEDWWKATVLLYAGKTKKPETLIREAMQQGAHDLAYACWQQTNKRLDNELQEVLKKARYADLEYYLKNGEWEKADQETYRLMITEVGKEEGQWLDREDLLNFPCEPLRIIDGVWVTHSKGQFGFSVQKERYLKCGSIADGKLYREALEKFIMANGWQMRGLGIKYGIQSPKGHLPYKATHRGALGGHEHLVSVFSRTQICKL